MADITQVKVGNTTYDIKDADAARVDHGHSGVYQPVGNYATTNGNNTYAGNNVFTNNNFAVRASGVNDDSWIMLTNNVTSSYYAFGIRRPYTSYGLQMKYHPDTTNQDSSRPGDAQGTSDIYYDIYHQGNYTKIPAATTSAAGLMSTTDKTKLDNVSSINEIDLWYGGVYDLEVDESGISWYDNFDMQGPAGPTLQGSVTSKVPIVAGSNISITKNANGLAEISATKNTFYYDPTNKILTIS